MKTQYAERIFLLGPTGSGKSAVGPRLAALLGWRFLDLDGRIEQATGSSIPEIFAHEGEAGFRERESAALAQAARESRVVIATGGGVGERPENLERIGSAGWGVSLLVTPETALARRQAAALEAGVRLGEHRPMLGGAAPLDQLRALYERRRAWYAAADDVIVADVLAPDQLAVRIAAGLIGRGRLAPAGAQPRTIQVNASGGSYEAVVVWGALASLGERLKDLKLPLRLHVVADASVADLYESSVLENLTRAGFVPSLFRVPPGETSKSREQWSAILDWLAERRAERNEAVVALGGGVVGDLAGFAAATYLRGMPLIQAPTSLLAQVDASVGGKVGIDHPRGKNLIGAFHQPRLVVADPAALLTLAPRQRIEGWAEVVKHGVALDAAYFERIERDADALLAMCPAAVTAAVAGSVALKARIVAEDERESGRRALLNYGHTLAHAIEAVTGYSVWLHGEAVAVGMSFAARLGLRAGITPANVVSRQDALLDRFGLPMRAGGLSARELLRAALWDKKARGGRLRWALPTALGESALFDDIREDDVRATLLEIGAVDDQPPESTDWNGAERANPA